MKYLSEWTEDWPTEPGMYLFYGDFIQVDHFSPELKLVKAYISNHEKRFMTLIADGSFLYKSEQKGLFRKIEIEVPDASK